MEREGEGRVKGLESVREKYKYEWGSGETGQKVCVCVGGEG